MKRIRMRYLPGAVRRQVPLPETPLVVHHVEAAAVLPDSPIPTPGVSKVGGESSVVSSQLSVREERVVH
jgi:hypothetical protein